MPKRPYWDVVSLDSERVENPSEEGTQCKDDTGNNDDILILCSRELKNIYNKWSTKWSYEKQSTEKLKNNIFFRRSKEYMSAKSLTMAIGSQ